MHLQASDFGGISSLLSQSMDEKKQMNSSMMSQRSHDHFQDLLQTPTAPKDGEGKPSLISREEEKRKEGQWIASFSQAVGRLELGGSN